MKWRLAYGNELDNECKILRNKYENLMDPYDEDVNQNIPLSKLIKKDWTDVQTFAKNGKFDLLLLLNDNLETFEMAVGYLRSILKIEELPYLI